MPGLFDEQWKVRYARTMSSAFVPMVAGVALAVAAVGAMIALDTHETDETDETTGMVVSADQVSRRPTTFSKRRVIVGGQAERVVEGHAFVLGGPRFGDGRRLLVVARDPVAVRAAGGARHAIAGDLVQLAGQVRTVDARDREQGLGTDIPVDLTEFDRMPAVVAEELVVTPLSGKGRR